MNIWSIFVWTVAYSLSLVRRRLHLAQCIRQGRTLVYEFRITNGMSYGRAGNTVCCNFRRLGKLCPTKRNGHAPPLNFCIYNKISKVTKNFWNLGGVDNINIDTWHTRTVQWQVSSHTYTAAQCAKCKDWFVSVCASGVVLMQMLILDLGVYIVAYMAFGV